MSFLHEAEDCYTDMFEIDQAYEDGYQDKECGLPYDSSRWNTDELTEAYSDGYYSKLH